ncbi:MarR family winged helix-turn-helix transcriptional regulator [Actinokineospora bangkokensis]|uniref:Transcriptional regulator n=1 Tax=Actinokineospora bangkokensis TaxID=1193682 RepID=A0A1Q9LLC0_9PSEU|nr:MarR family winged helix-turn-helix transcriptional regulator [Actinokineospora bangkokensis]OLR92821.1 transcriptional regulator [Actinokineospora bangkokensis]
MADVDPLTTRWSPDQVEVMHRLRDWAVGFAQLNHHLGEWVGLPVSDANALGQIIWAAETGDPLSPARLARHLGMTTGATTILLNRLEGAGHIHRSRESADRRRVTLRPDPAAREKAQRFLAFAGVEIATTLHTADPAELRAATAFLRKLTAAISEANQRLDREGPPSPT